MSSQQYASPLRLKIQASRVLDGTALILHVGAIAFALVSDVSLSVQLALVCAVLCSLLVFMSVQGYVAEIKPFVNLFPRFDEVVWGDNENWLLIDKKGEEQRAELLTSSFVHPKLTVVNLKILGKPWYCRYRSFVFLPDNIDAETFRRLRIRLRWYSTPDQDNSVVIE